MFQATYIAFNSKYSETMDKDYAYSRGLSTNASVSCKENCLKQLYSNKERGMKFGCFLSITGSIKVYPCQKLTNWLTDVFETLCRKLIDEIWEAIKKFLEIIFEPVAPPPSAVHLGIKMWIFAKFKNKNVNFMAKNNGHQNFI